MAEFPEQPQDRLRKALGDLYARGPAVPRGVDEAIVGLARRRLGNWRTFRVALRWTGAAVAAAAMIVLGIRLTWPDAPQPMMPQMVIRAEDVNADGRVDMVDAYLLARRVQAGTTEPRFDFKVDGRIDQSDVDAVALRAVALTGGRDAN